MKKLFIAIAGVLSALIMTAPAAIAQYVEGQHYVRLDQPVRTNDPSRIEVAEVFAYSSPHCFQFEPILKSWQKRQPRDVYLIQVHTTLGPQTDALTRGYYTSTALKVQDRTHMAVFNALHVQRKNLSSSADWAEFLAAYGVDKGKALNTYDSFGVTSQVKNAEARVRGYKIAATPEMVVDGRYRVSSRATGGHEEMLRVVDFLVARVRNERAAR